MHYKDGTEVKLGDIAIGPCSKCSTVIGMVVGMSPGADTCNIIVQEIGRVVHGEGARLVVQPSQHAGSYTAKEFSRVM